MKHLIFFLICSVSALAQAELTMKCSGDDVTMEWSMDSGAFTVEAPKSAYKMNGNKTGTMKETCVLQPTFSESKGFSTFGCYTLSSSLIIGDKKITEAIYKKDHVVDDNKNGVADGQESRTILADIAKSKTEFQAGFSAFDNADESTPIELSSLDADLTCTIK